MKNKKSTGFREEKYYFTNRLFCQIFKVLRAVGPPLFFEKNSCNSHLSPRIDFQYLFYLFLNIFKLPDFFSKDLFKALMCSVLHMARCTNVATFESCPFTPKSCGVYKRQ